MIGSAHIGTAGFDPVVIGLVAALAVLSLFSTTLWAVLPKDEGDVAITAFLGIVTAVFYRRGWVFLFRHPTQSLDFGQRRAGSFYYL